MKPTSKQFKHNIKVALSSTTLRQSMGFAERGFVAKREKAKKNLPQWEAIRASIRDVKNHTLEHLDFYLEEYERRVKDAGGHVHWAETAEDACKIIVGICKEADAKMITKGKSMVGEEIALNEALEQADFDVVETDLGEYIIQLAKEPPSHIIAPALHKTKDQVADLFAKHHGSYQENKTRSDLVQEARQVLREKFIQSDVGITGANFLIAETGQHVLITNEGNGDLTSNLPGVHITVTGIDKVVPTLEDATAMIRLLDRSATGQEISNYTSFYNGPGRDGDLDSAKESHVVLVDNGRSVILGTKYKEMLRCFRCGACLNHCPVYTSIGGHAYGWVYPGPMGSVLSPLMIGNEEAADLPNACTLNGRCKTVCPMSIPLPDMLRQHRHDQFKQKIQSGTTRWGIQLWAYFAKRPRLYHIITAAIAKVLHITAGKQGRFSKLPMASSWTRVRDFPAPGQTTFQQMWKQGKKK